MALDGIFVPSGASKIRPALDLQHNSRTLTVCQLDNAPTTVWLTNRKFNVVTPTEFSRLGAVCQTRDYMDRGLIVVDARIILSLGSSYHTYRPLTDDVRLGSLGDSEP